MSKRPIQNVAYWKLRHAQAMEMVAEQREQAARERADAMRYRAVIVATLKDINANTGYTGRPPIWALYMQSALDHA